MLKAAIHYRPAVNEVCNSTETVQNICAELSQSVLCVALTCETSPKPQKCGLEPEGHKCIYGHISLLKVYSNTLSIIKIIYLLHLMVNNIIVFYRLKPKPKKKILTGNTCYKCLIDFFLSMRKLTSKQTYENIII